MTPKTLPINEIQEIFDMKQLKKIAAAVLIAAMLGLLLPQLGVNAEALKRGSRGDLVRQLQTRLRSGVITAERLTAYTAQKPNRRCALSKSGTG